jgi:hypothetical protein
LKADCWRKFASVETAQNSISKGFPVLPCGKRGEARHLIC